MRASLTKRLAPSSFFAPLLPWCEYQGERIKLLTSSCSDQSGPAGQVCSVENGLTIACGQGAVRVQKLQRGGKSAQDADTFLRGLNIPIGAQLD